MLAAGYSTQAALAKKIAIDEELETVPKDTVNRVFRQEYVSPHTIARLAKVLAVEPYTLYLSKQEDEQLQQSFSASTQAKSADKNTPNVESHLTRLVTPSYRKLILIGLSFLTGIIVLSYWQTFSPSQPSINESTSFAPLNKPLLGQYSLVLLPTQHTRSLADALRKVMINDIKMVVINRSLVDKNSMSIDIARSFQADGVVTIKTADYDRYQGLRVYLYFNNAEKLIWTGSVSQTELNQQVTLLAEELSSFLKASVGLVSEEKLSEREASFASITAQEKYLKARRLLDNQQKELNLKRAQGFLNSAIKESPKFARAYAALCEALIYESWMGDEKSILEDAQGACNAAIELAPQDSYAQATTAYLYRRSGRILKSIDSYQQILTQWPNNIDATSGLASTYLEAFRQQIEELPDAMDKALQYAMRATQAEPEYWKHHFNLGVMHYFTGDVEKAIVSNEMAVSKNENELAYTNLGSMNFCLGNHQKARDAFTRSQKLAPESYIGDEFLGMTYYFLEDFEKSADLRQRALAKINDSETGSIHQMWGNLGDSYRQVGKLPNSVDAYLKAIKIIERDTLRGNIAVADKVYRHYYYLTLTKIDSEHFSEDVLDESSERLAEYLASDMESSAYVRLAQIHYLKKDFSTSRLALDKATTRCPGYGSFPDLKGLFNQQVASGK